MTSYAQHPLSAAFPSMSQDEFQSLKDSIEILGVQNPITLYDGMVLDGWHRYRAAQDLGLSCPEVELSPDVDPVDFVKAQNKERRHLSVGAWALIEAELWDWFSRGRPTVNKAGIVTAPFPLCADPSDDSAPGAHLSDGSEDAADKRAPGAHLSDGVGKARKTAAEIAQGGGYSTRTVKQAKKVLRDAIPEIQNSTKKDEISLKDAEVISNLPKEEQATLAAAGPEAIKKAARFRGKPKKGPAADAIRAGLAAAKAENEAEKLRERLAQIEDALAAHGARNVELEAENKALKMAADPDVLTRVQEIQQYARTVEQSRDHYMNENAELKKEVKKLQRVLARRQGGAA